ncbi:3-ketodihydrosphingosine reductase [Agromyces rhizosphaerae]|uniref:3-ketodihydrosphingosine reductase n=1 Tax=Agromyces rhizosphaerae TaxID=88374 RepID=A0A9W6CU12_9MICO|nr:SDR family NAD(P)-dependent oxidoreductase [Agromyces rhizosphaerae]GLI29021.1 3-ketodihydrosphingosine reductase [Agromyces rhizosphaerae]
MDGYHGRLVFITGGSSGIGLAAAQRLAAEGADVVLVARGAEQLADAREAVAARRRREDQRVATVRLDVGDVDAIAPALTAAMDAHGVPDLLVTAAGRAIPRRFEDVTAAQLDETLRINLAGTWLSVHAVLPAMRERGTGHIATVGSLGGLIGIAGFTDYAASKFGVVGFSEALRSELAAERIGVSVLCPPDTDTPGLAAEARTKPPETHAVSANASLLTADVVARELLAGIRRNRFLIVPGRSARLSHLAARLAPGLVHRQVDAVVRRSRGGSTRAR